MLLRSAEIKLLFHRFVLLNISPLPAVYLRVAGLTWDLVQFLDILDVIYTVGCGANGYQGLRVVAQPWTEEATAET